MKIRAIALTIVLVLLAGCNRGSDNSSGSNANGGAAGSGGKRLKVVYIPKNSGNPYFDEVDKGFVDASKVMGFSYSQVAPSTAEATSQIPVIKAQIQQGADVIAITPNSPDALNQALDQAKSQGITVITVDADLVGNESHRDAAVLPTDFSQVGSSQIELLGSLIGYQGDIAILSATADAPNQNAWIKVMTTTLAQPKYAKMKLVDTVYGDDQPQKSTTECEGLLAKHPGLKGIVSPTSVGLAASATVFEQQGVYPGGPHANGTGVQLTGLSTPNQLKKAVDKGVVKAFQLWSPHDMGFLAAFVGVRIHDKSVVPKPGLEIAVASLGKRKFSDKLELIGGPLVTFDKSDITKYNF